MLVLYALLATKGVALTLDFVSPGRLQKITAARLIEGLEIRQSAYSLTVQFLTVVPFFKVRLLGRLRALRAFGFVSAWDADLAWGHTPAMLPVLPSL